MTDRKDDYYQPWLRDPAPTPGAAPRPDEGLAKPKEEPPVGIDLSRYPADAPPPARQQRSGQVKDGAARAWSALRRSAGAFADWTIRAGERADIPARVEAMEIPRRTRKMAAASAAALSRGARAVGRGSAKAGRAAAGASGQAWEKMALGDKVARLSSEAGRGIGEVADKATLAETLLDRGYDAAALKAFDGALEQLAGAGVDVALEDAQLVLEVLADLLELGLFDGQRAGILG